MWKSQKLQFFSLGFSGEELHHSVNYIENRNFKHNAERARLRNVDWKRRRLVNDRRFITGIVQKVYTVKPKKPNSGNRKVCKVRLLNQRPKKEDARLGKKSTFQSSKIWTLKVPKFKVWTLKVSKVKSLNFESFQSSNFELFP